MYRQFPMFVIIQPGFLMVGNTREKLQRVFSGSSVEEFQNNVERSVIYLVTESQLNAYAERNPIKEATVITIETACDIVYQNSRRATIPEKEIKEFISLAQRAGDAIRGLYSGLELADKSLDLPVLQKFTVAANKLADRIKR